MPASNWYATVPHNLDACVQVAAGITDTLVYVMQIIVTDTLVCVMQIIDTRDMIHSHVLQCAYRAVSHMRVLQYVHRAVY